MTHSFPRSTPEAQGVASAALMAFVEAADVELSSLHSLMIVRHGAVIAEGWWAPYNAAEPHMLYSLSKSFTSTAIGLLIEEGGIALDDPVVSFFPDDLPDEVSENLAAMTVHHLLSMSTGHDEDTLGPVLNAPDGNWVRAFLAQPVQHAPGIHFAYNTPATYMLSAILQTRTGMTLLAYLRPRLFEPLGIEHPTWESDPRGINVGGWGLNITTEDIARFGQLYLQRGEWEGRQLVPAAWVEAATSRQIDNGDDPASDWAQGYGYQFWRCRHNAYRGDGAFGQFCVVLPEHDTVIAITSGLEDMQAVLDLVWAHVLPALGTESLKENPPATDALRERKRSLALVPPIGAATSPLAPDVSGVRYALAPNDWHKDAITFEFGDEGATVHFEGAGGAYTLRAGWGTWQPAEDDALIFDGSNHSVQAASAADAWEGDTFFPYDRVTWRRQAASAAGAWEGDSTYTFQTCFRRTPYIETLRCVFENGGVMLHRSLNVSFGSTEFEPVSGRAADS
jgi:CubicO group peptidase (beta-lactamase class C family)